VTPDPSIVSPPSVAPAVAPIPSQPEAPKKDLSGYHQGISGTLAFLCGVAAIWCHVFNRDDLAAGFTASAGAFAGYCGGHLKGSQTANE